MRLVQGADCSSGTHAADRRPPTPRAPTASPAWSAGATYLICQTQPPGYANGTQNPGPSGSSPAANVIAITALPATGSPDNHFGERIGSLAGSVYADSSPATPANTNNGVRDPGEAGIANVPVTLTGRDITGAVVNLSTTTDGNGDWRFDDLLQSDATGYTVTEGVIPPAAGTFNDGRETAGSVGGSIAVNDQISGIVLGGGVQGTSYLFGELPVAPLSGTVYIDRDRDNTLDPTPADGRIPGVTLTVYPGSSCSGTPVATTTTDASGNYSVSGLSVGLTYTICQTQPPGYGDGGVNPGTSGSSAAPNAITVTSLPAAGSAGNHFAERVGSIAGVVYLDANNDGARGAAEAGIPGVTVTLSGNDVNGTPVSRTTTSDATGAWRFDDLLGRRPGRLRRHRASGAAGGRRRDHPQRPHDGRHQRRHRHRGQRAAQRHRQHPAGRRRRRHRLSVWRDPAGVGGRRRLHRHRQQRHPERPRRRRPGRRLDRRHRHRRHRCAGVAHGHDGRRRQLQPVRPAPRHLHRHRADAARRAPAMA